MSRGYAAVDGELEDELSRELEAEFENELEDELEGEFEDEDEFEDELGGLARELEDELEDEVYGEYEDEDEFESEFEAVVRELEDEFELESEDEDFTHPARRVYPDAEMMAQLAFQAENAETEDEAEAFLGALAPLAFQAAKWAAPKIIKHGPQLIRGAVNLGRKLWRNPATRRAVRHIPKIIGRTARDVGRRYADGRPINARYITRRLVGHTVNSAQNAPANRRNQQQRRRGRPQQRRRRPAARGGRRTQSRGRAGAARRGKARGRARRR
ncbi:MULTISPECIES: hypothetical protein [Amycolatopsis]|uniref:hypothetical protein n=1 Tax=Amycolatopsis TaxID=1813 RepID=UPI00093DE86B|nr:hypothetical protein [Amycolatopsis sp. CB00013]OKJ89899.1 hypothetical protein AMK34_40180 [Amycolatopsis sp. CB00013]